VVSDDIQNFKNHSLQLSAHFENTFSLVALDALSSFISTKCSMHGNVFAVKIIMNKFIIF
jgi:hypothetical protein